MQRRRRKLEAEAKKREKDEAKKREKLERQLLMESIYGKSQENMARSSYSRAMKWTASVGVEERTASPSSFIKLRNSPRTMSFGNLPRAYFKGGGEIDKEKTSKLKSSQSNSELQSMSRFLKHPPFDSKRAFIMREREKPKELFGDFRFSAKTETERVNEEIDKVRSLTIEVDDERYLTARERLKRKQMSARKFVGGRFSIVPPQKGRLLPIASIDVGSPWQRPVLQLGKARDKQKELGDTEFTIYKRSKQDIRDAKLRGTPKPKHKSYRKSLQEFRIKVR